jgi:hypothetical protein
LSEARDACRQSRVAARLRCHLLALLICFGRHTLTAALRASGRQFVDWTADYRLYSQGRVHVDALFAVVRRDLCQRLEPQRPLVVGLDDSIHRKRGQRIPGAGWQRDPIGPPFQVNFVWGQRVLQMSGALPCGTEGAARGLPIDFVLAPAAKRPGKKATDQQQQAYRQEQKRLNLNRQALDRVEHLQEQMRQDRETRPLHICVDGRFTNSTFCKGLAPAVTLIGRVRQDARLFALPGRRSRKRCYGRRLPTPQQVLKDESIPWQTVRVYAAGKTHEFRIKTVAPVRWKSAGGQRQLRLVVIAPLGYRLRKRGKLLYRKPAFLICTDVDLPVQQVVQEFVWRWEVEVNFRDEKSLLGVGQPQVRNEASVRNAPATQVAGYALLHLAAVRAYGSEGRPQTLPAPAWYRNRPQRPSTQDLINELRWELWGGELGINEGFWDQEARTQKPLDSPGHVADACCYADQG